MKNVMHSDGRSLNVKFYSHFVTNSVNKSVRQTVCKLATVDETKVGKDKYTNVAEGVATQNSKDVDSRPEGQRRAFGNAIKAFPKAERMKMWRQYDPTMKLAVKVTPVKVDAVAGQVAEEATVD